MGKRIYKIRFVYLLIAYFFYYWLFLTVLILFPAFFFATGFVFLQIVGIVGTGSGYPEFSVTELWFYLLFGMGISIWAIWYLYRSFKKMFRGHAIVEGTIVRKEVKEYDEGCGYFITINKKEYELSERGFHLVRERSKVRVWYSEKLCEIIRIERA